VKWGWRSSSIAGHFKPKGDRRGKRAIVASCLGSCRPLTTILSNFSATTTTKNGSAPVSSFSSLCISAAALQWANIIQEASAIYPKRRVSELGLLFLHGVQSASIFQIRRRRNWDSNRVRKIKRRWKLWCRRSRWWSEMERAEMKWMVRTKNLLGQRRSPGWNWDE